MCAVPALMTALHIDKSGCVSLFLSTLLDPLLSCVQWSFAFSLVRHFLACFGIWDRELGMLKLSLVMKGMLPACCFALNASSSSSRSFFSFFGAFNGLTLPPCRLSVIELARIGMEYYEPSRLAPPIVLCIKESLDNSSIWCSCDWKDRTPLIKLVSL